MSRSPRTLFVVAGALASHACFTPEREAPAERLGVATAPIVWGVQASLLPINPQPPGIYGREVDLEGTVAVVTDNLEGQTTGEGAAFMYDLVDGVWVPDVKLETPVQGNGNRFGEAVSLSGSTLAVGSPHYNLTTNDEGSVFVYVDGPSGWAFQQHLVAPDAGQFDEFGDAVALDGDTLIIGAPYDDDGAVNSGAAYVFVRSGNAWSFEDKLVAPDPAAGDFFGDQVALDGDTAIVGAYRRHSSGVDDAGGAYVFDRSGSTWSLTQTLEAPTPTEDSQFGVALALEGDSLVVGEPGWTSETGRAHVYVLQGATWTHQQALAPLGIIQSYVGDAVDLSGDRLVLGAWNDFAGSAFLYERVGSTWGLVQTLKEPNGIVNNQFGHRVAIDGERMVVSAYNGDTAGPNLGSAYVFVRSGETCVDGFCCATPCDEGCGRCDEAGNEGLCRPVGAGIEATGSCTGFLCVDGFIGCPTPCDNGGDCADGFFCTLEGACLPQAAIGEPCPYDDGCLSGQCADGVCCDVDCMGSCEACAEPGNVGTCVLVTGSPRPGHSACPADSCDDAVLKTNYSCRGEDSVCLPDETPCEPYGCSGETVACLDSCLSDEQCAPDFDCLVAEQICLPSEPLCNGDDELLLPTGETESCRPYRCTESGTCRTGCSYTGDCASGFVCSSEGRCTEPPAPLPPSSCAMAAPARTRGGWWLGAALALIGLRRRRRSIRASG